MKFKYDHDLHVHSYLSLCSEDPEHTNERILQYAEENGLTSLCLTDHFWDEAIPGALGEFYQKQTVPYIRQALPLPQRRVLVFQ